MTILHAKVLELSLLSKGEIATWLELMRFGLLEGVFLTYPTRCITEHTSALTRSVLRNTKAWHGLSSHIHCFLRKVQPRPETDTCVFKSLTRMLKVQKNLFGEISWKCTFHNHPHQFELRFTGTGISCGQLDYSSWKCGRVPESPAWYKIASLSAAFHNCWRVFINMGYNISVVDFIFGAEKNVFAFFCTA